MSSQNMRKFEKVPCCCLCLKCSLPTLPTYIVTLILICCFRCGLAVCMQDGTPTTLYFLYSLHSALRYRYVGSGTAQPAWLMAVWLAGCLAGWVRYMGSWGSENKETHMHIYIYTYICTRSSVLAGRNLVSYVYIIHTLPIPITPAPCSRVCMYMPYILPVLCRNMQGVCTSTVTCI